MVAQSPPFAVQNGSHSAQLFRLAAFSPWRDQSGVVGLSDLSVTAQSTPNMSVQVAAGRAWLKGTQVASVSGGAWSTQGGYYGYNDAPVTVTVSAADPTNPRIDAVVAYVTDQFYSGSTNTLVLGVITGTPAPSPAVPAVPNNGLLLGTLAVAANATSIGNGNISPPSTTLQTVVRGGIQPVISGDTTAGTQLGQYRDHPLRGLERWNSVATAWQPAGRVLCTSSTRPSSPTDGLEIYETDTKAWGYYESQTGHWIMFDSLWQTYTPVLATTANGNTWTQGNGTAIGRYLRKGREVTVEANLVLGSTSSYGAGSTGAILVTPPTGYYPASWVSGGGTQTTAGTSYVNNGSAVFGNVMINNSGTASARRFAFYTPAGANALTGAASGAGTWTMYNSGHYLVFSTVYETQFEA